MTYRVLPQFVIEEFFSPFRYYLPLTPLTHASSAVISKTMKSVGMSAISSHLPYHPSCQA